MIRHSKFLLKCIGNILKTTIKSPVCILIPIYKSNFSKSELVSIKQGLEVFSSYSVIFVCPKSLDLSELQNLTQSYKNIEYKKLEDENFFSVDSYNRMLLDQNFYQNFAPYEFMLIYQTDAYVFSNELEKWCHSGLDFVGAPWFRKFDVSGKYKDFIPVAGNGGFSLRNITKINDLMTRKLSFKQMLLLRKILAKNRVISHKNLAFTWKFFVTIKNKTNSLGHLCKLICNNGKAPNEDYFFAQTLPLIFPEFISAKATQAISFSFEAQPQTLYQLNDYKLPFGCHAFEKYSPDFWKKFINF